MAPGASRARFTGRWHGRVLGGPDPPQAPPDRGRTGSGTHPEGRRIGLYHFGLRVRDSDADLLEALERVAASGAKVLGSFDHTVTHSVYIADPDGNEVELYIDVPGVNWREDPELMAAPIKPLVL